MVTHLPEYLRGERALAEYFESMGLSVESVSVCREVGALKRFLDMRTAALLRLESAWTRYVRNPSTVDVQPPLQQQQDRSPLIDVNVDDRDAEALPRLTMVPNRPRPTLRTKWFGRKVDALEYLQQEFEKADEQVKTRRKNGRFRATHSAFVTFENMSSAQMAAQVAHAPTPQQCLTSLAPEPRDIVWSNVTHSPMTLRVRESMVMCAMGLLLFFWLVPTSALATLLSFKEIKKIWPQLGELIDANPRVRAIVQNSLPSVAIMSLNAVLPLSQASRTSKAILRGVGSNTLCSGMNVVFIFLVASTYWQLVRDLASSPAKGVEKLADALAAGKARHFFLSYVILQGLGIMPLQLLSLGVMIPRIIYRICLTRTPRDFAELNAPPMINYGVVYPQAILIFVITLLYSVIQPLILIFGALYFGVAYVVYKYKLLFGASDCSSSGMWY
ncbi:hypothetical protein IEO21_09458 [Rhodonia placenta]|uniref:CSC1/OSCA1-like 7TM region domain-containing protein n=1 Tax=Rhodonia placenta TaxID=104341 RepID=A0A8H7TXQ4_9APHY|nr:hypothetical protein IEO21_09458 [Postia placenta]